MRFHRHMAKALCLIAFAVPALAEEWSGQLLDRAVRIDVPAPFVPEPAFSDLADGQAIVEFLPPGETIEGWTQMLTLTALGGAAPGMTPDQAVMAMAESLASGFEAACPNGRGVQDLGSPLLPGAEATFSAWLACDEVNGNGQSEAMLVLIFTVGGTIYTAQWAEHGDKTDGPPVFDLNHWMPRMDTLATLAL